MKRTYRFAENIGYVSCELTGQKTVRLPIIPGILKHPLPHELGGLLRDERVAKKYTRLALQKMAWPVLKQFPYDWLWLNIDAAQLPESRDKAIRFLLS